MRGGHEGSGHCRTPKQGYGGTSALPRLDFWVEPQALAALLVANNHIAASACGSIQPQFLSWTKHEPPHNPTILLPKIVRGVAYEDELKFQ